MRNEFKTHWIPQFSFPFHMTLLIYILLSNNLLFFLFLSFFIYSFLTQTQTHFLILSTETTLAKQKYTTKRHTSSACKNKTKNETAANVSWCHWLMTFSFDLVWFNGHTIHTYFTTFKWAFKAHALLFADNFVFYLFHFCLMVTARKHVFNWWWLLKFTLQMSFALPFVRALRNHSGIFISFVSLYLLYNPLYFLFVLYRPHTYTATQQSLLNFPNLQPFFHF